MSIRIAHIVICFQLAISFHANLCFSQTAGKEPIREYSTNETGAMLSNAENEPVFQSLSPDFEYNAVRCIFKDHKGYMWFGTESGLIRYDGIKLFVYENITGSATSLNNNAVNAIAEDSSKNLWIGTSGGLNLYNREKDNFSGVPNSHDTINVLNQILISALFIDNKSVLWVGSYIGGLYAYDHSLKKTMHYSHNVNNPKSISSDRITCITMDKEGNLWIGTQNGLNVLTASADFKQFFNEPANLNSISNNYITSLTVDRNGCIWAGTRGGGLNRFLKGREDFTIERYTTDSRRGKISNDYILSLFADERGFIWIGTDNGGLNRLNTETSTVNCFKTEDRDEYGLYSNSIWSLYGDEEDRLWIGTYNKGINIIDENFRKFGSFQKISLNDKSLSSNDIMGFTEDDKGNVWIATNGGGICRFDPGKRQFSRLVYNNSNHEPISNNAVQDILFDSDGNLWIGTWAGGIDRLNRDGIKLRNYRLINSMGIENNNVFTLYQDPQGNIWAGSAGNGLFLYDKKTDEFFSFSCENDPGLISGIAYVTALLTDTENNLWVGTLYGLVVLKWQNNRLNQCINYLHSTDPSSISSNVIVCIFQDRKGRIWIGTSDKGLNLFNKHDSSFTAFQKKDGLAANSIKDMLEDDEGFLWISTSMGICRINYEKNSFRNYSREDGLNSNEFNVRSCLRSGSGEFYFGSENGFHVFYPGEIKENTYVPAVYLTELRINNNSVVIGAKDSPLEKHISETAEIILNYKQTSFSIDFVALNYTRPSRNQFCYKLEGFDEDWNCIGTQRTANYTNIMPGKYVFIVKGSNNDGIWNDKTTELRITIKPPYWKTWWAKLFYVLFLSVTVMIAIRIRNERISIKNKLKLEQMAREKEHELNESNVHFFTNIAHEFRTPLNLILAPIESLISSAESKIKEHLLMIYRNANRLLQLTNNLMDFRKLEEGRTKLKVQHGDIQQYIKEISTYFRINSKSRQIDFTVETAEISIIGWFDPEKLETILLNLLSNAYQHTPNKGRIWVTANIITGAAMVDKYGDRIRDIQTISRFVEISVTDNGEGISSEELPCIFDKFYRGKSSEIRRNQGTGIGLTLTKGLVEMHHGKIWAESIPGVETRFTFVLPIDPGAYEENDVLPESVGNLKRNIIADPESEITLNKKDTLTETNQGEEKPDILIVEDNEELRAFLVKELSTKFRVAQAHDGKSGIELARSDIPDLIVSDIIMPNVSGIELCKSIKSDVRTCHIPVILLTAKTSIKEQIEGMETGADAYITKPFNIQFLYAQINQLIRSRRELYAYFSKEVYIIPNKLAEHELDQKFIKEAIDYIILNIADNSLNVEGLAEHLKLSRSNVYRKIKALTGQSIIEFITLIRLKQAIKMMETSQYSLAEIAYQAGFTSPSYFTKCFKKQYGKPPSEFLTK